MEGCGAGIVLFPAREGEQASAKAGLKAANTPEMVLEKILCAKCESRAAFLACIQDLG